jgi:DNA-binding response OmpR family regulator
MEYLRKMIIYVDGSSFGLMTVKNRLREIYKVFPAPSFSAFCGILDDITPDLIMIDAKSMDGETFRQLREDERCADTPVLIVTSAEGEGGESEEWLSRGAAACIAKPFTTEALASAIENAIMRKPKNIAEKKAPSALKRPCVLAVDDVPGMLRAINYALRFKYDVHALASPSDVKDYLTKVTPDLIILDYKMPEMNGVELIPVIRAFPEHKETPIMILTSGLNAEQKAEALNMGVCDYIIKPFDPAVLREKIDRYIS